MNTIQVHYFAHKDGLHFVAVAPERYVETILFWELQNLGSARIEMNRTGLAVTSYYERIESGYSACSYDTYMNARTNAITALVQFFGDAEEFTTPSARPLYVDRPNSQGMINDLPF